jgi:hypothetical protein
MPFRQPPCRFYIRQLRHEKTSYWSSAEVARGKVRPGPGQPLRFEFELALFGFVFVGVVHSFLFIVHCHNRTYVHLNIRQIGFVLHKRCCRGSRNPKLEGEESGHAGESETNPEGE